MAEVKIDCPVCFDTHQCFEDTVENKESEFKSYMCLRETTSDFYLHLKMQLHSSIE
jgi:hypothetical protein